MFRILMFVALTSVLCVFQVAACNADVTLELETHFSTGLPSTSYDGPTASVHSQTLTDCTINNEDNINYLDDEQKHITIFTTIIAIDSGDTIVVDATLGQGYDVPLEAYQSVDKYQTTDDTTSLSGGSYSYTGQAGAWIGDDFSDRVYALDCYTGIFVGYE